MLSCSLLSLLVATSFASSLTLPECAARLKSMDVELFVSTSSGARRTWYQFSDQHRLRLMELGLVDMDGVMPEKVKLLVRALDRHDVPLAPDRLATPANDDDIRTQLDLKTGSGYVFFEAASLLPVDLIEAVRALPPGILDGIRVREGKVVVTLHSTLQNHLPDEWDYWPRPPEATRWFEDKRTKFEAVQQLLPTVVERVRTKFMALLAPSEAERLKHSEGFLRSTTRATGIARHKDSMYLRVILSVSNMLTMVWDPETHQVVGAPEGWGVAFSGTIRLPEHATYHYAPRAPEGNSDRRDAIFIDFAP